MWRSTSSLLHTHLLWCFQLCGNLPAYGWQRVRGEEGGGESPVDPGLGVGKCRQNRRGESHHLYGLIMRAVFPAVRGGNSTSSMLAYSRAQLPCTLIREGGAIPNPPSLPHPRAGGRWTMVRTVPPVHKHPVPRHTPEGKRSHTLRCLSCTHMRKRP